MQDLRNYGKCSIFVRSRSVYRLSRNVNKIGAALSRAYNLLQYIISLVQRVVGVKGIWRPFYAYRNVRA